MGSRLVTTEKPREYLRLTELKLGLEALSKADWIKLGKASEVLCWGLPCEGQDLLEEVLCRALEGKRNCPEDVPVLIFLIQAMKSLVSAYLKMRRHNALDQAIMSNPEDQEELAFLLDGKGDLATPEELLIAKKTLEQIDSTFTGDETAQMVLMGKLDGLSPSEIQQICDLGPVAYASTLRSIRRKLDKLNIEESFA